MWFAAAALAAPPLHASEAPPPALADDAVFVEQVADALRWGDAEALVRLHAQAVHPQAKRASGLGSRFRLFLDGLDEISDSRRTDVHTLRLLATQFEQWRAADPQQILWPVMHAWALHAQAWKVRGGGYANTVGPDAWREFERLVRASAEATMSLGEAGHASPITHWLLLSNGRSLGIVRERLVQVLEDGLRRHPHVDTLVRTTMTALQPIWGGSAEDVDRFIQRFSGRFVGLPADAGYAWLYSAAAEQHFSHALFHDSRADKARVLRGYRWLVAEFKAPEIRQRAAYLACMARDRDAYLEFAESGMEPLLEEQWEDNPKVTQASCQAWATRQ